MAVTALEGHMSYGLNNTQAPYGSTATGQMKEKIPSGYKKYQLNNYTPQQMQLHEQNFAHVGPDSYLSRLASGDQSFFDEVEAPGLRQFSGLQGGLASRFAGMGGLGAGKSSGAMNTQTAAASNFAQDLQSQRMDYRNKAIQDLMNYSNQLLSQKPYETGLVEKEKPWWQEAATSFAGGAGKTAGSAFGNWFGGLF